MSPNLRSTGIALLLTFFCAAAATGGTVVRDDGYSDAERALTYRGLYDGTASDPSPCRDVVIADRTRRNLFFGLYRTTMMTQPGWDLFDRSLSWVNRTRPINTARIYLFTYNGTLNPIFSGELDGIAVYNHLLGLGAYNITVDKQVNFPAAYVLGYDVVIYVSGFGYDATSVLNQGVPLLTTSAMQTDEMGIGTGVGVMHDFRDYSYVTATTHPVTSPFAPGLFQLSSAMWMDATTASGNGIALLRADPGECP